MTPLRTYLARARRHNPARTTTAPRQTTRRHPGTGHTPAHTSHAPFPPLTLSIR